MVDVTIFVEGGVAPSLTDPQLTPDSSNLLRESFYNLLSQKIPDEKFNLSIIPVGGYKIAVSIFSREAPVKLNSTILIDFAEPSDELLKAKRTGIAKHSTLLFNVNDPAEFREECVKELGLDGFQERVFFMDREMETWILSQPDEIEKYAKSEGFNRKKSGDSISDHPSLKVSHPNLIKNPKTALNTIFIQFFEQQKMSGRKPRPYYPTKDVV